MGGGGGMSTTDWQTWAVLRSTPCPHRGRLFDGAQGGGTAPGNGFLPRRTFSLIGVGNDGVNGREGRGEDEGCQRSLCGPGRCAKSRDAGGHPRRNAAGIRFYAEGGGAGIHPRRNAAGIRFYAKGGGAGIHPRRNAAGIRFYAKGGGAGGHPRRNAAGIHGRGASSLGV